jgi:subtilisin family serine protease
MTMINGHRAARFLVIAATVTATVAGAGVAASAAPVGTIQRAGAAGAIGGSYIVVLKPGSSAAAQVTSSSVALARRYGGAVQRNYLTAVRGFAATMTSTAAGRLAADPSVAYVEQDRVVHLESTQNEPVWGLDRLDQRTLPLSRTYTYRSAANVTAYVLDTGIRTSHSEFGGRARNGWDFIDKDPVANDCNGHGTHVAGTVGGTTYGVAKDVQLVGVRVLGCTGSGSYSQIIAGIDWVTTNAVKPAVANMSLGGGASAALDDAVKRSIASGVTYALAAGNDNADACNQSPGRTPAAITAGATDVADARASFSNYGSCLDIFAPGVKIVSASYNSDSGTAMMSGTSMASPHVAGAAALVLGAYPAYTPAQVRDYLVAQAETGRVTNAGSRSPNLLLHTGGLIAPPPVVVPTTTPPVVVPTTTPPVVVPTTTSPVVVPTTTSPVVVPTTTPPVVVPTTTPPVVVPTTTAPTVTPAPTTTPTPVPCGPFIMGNNVMIMDLATIKSVRRVTGCSGHASPTTTVGVRIKHSRRGSLVLTLVAPNGTRYPLTAGSVRDTADDLVMTYTVNASGSPRNGTWTLQVRDVYRKDIGFLDSWTLRL